ncbi:hypothetical protein [Rhizobium metallidurans]|uniref:Transmembrane protein n=1 Tax=Rhizobium metallidurans TaxID=1265931 RepID=A0A7W6CUU7_9HYPH|nr:hypothetical protein [Rhizobium metallidurans]MBB3966826.1 hypothetical protein [Rhizobium metallidurans]
MSVLRKSMTTGSILLTLTTATLTLSSPAMANHDYIWGGAAAGFVGGMLLSQALRPYPYTYGYPDGYGYPYAYGYRYGYPYRYPYRAYRPYGAYPVYRSYYSQPYRRCHLEWRRNGWGEAYRVRVCPY